MGKKDAFMSILSAIGIMGLRWRYLPPALYVFNYHRVGNSDECGYNRNLFSCTVQRFREHLAVLKDRFDIVTIDRLAHFARYGYAGRRPLALMSFDDGYSDNYSLCFPILKQMEVPAVFFLPTAYVGSHRLLWSDEIAWILRNSRHTTMTLPYSAKPYDLSPERKELEPTIRDILGHVRRSPIPFDEQIDVIRQACGDVSPTGNDDRPQFVNWQQVREMCAAGMDIGSHTHSHTPLSKLTADQQRDEFASSRLILEAELQTRIRAVAYPVGERSSYTKETCRIACDVGYELGFNFMRNANSFPLTNALDIGRLAVDSDIDTFGIKSRVCFPAAYAKRVRGTGIKPSLVGR